MSNKTNIVEIVVPEDMPKWAQDAFDQGQFFRLAVEKVNALEATIQKMLECVESKFVYEYTQTEESILPDLEKVAKGES